MDRNPQGATRHATRSDKIEMLTDLVMGWYGFDRASDFRLRPYAMIVAIALHDRDAYTDTCTAAMIEEADAECGGKMRAMHDACSYPARPVRTR